MNPNLLILDNGSEVGEARPTWAGCSTASIVLPGSFSGNGVRRSLGTAWALATSRTRQPTQRGSRARRRLRVATKPAPWGIAEADNKAGAVEWLDHDDADVVVLDIQMPVEEG